MWKKKKQLQKNIIKHEQNKIKVTLQVQKTNLGLICFFTPYFSEDEWK